LFHNLLSLHFSLQFLAFIFFRFSSTWSSHLTLGLPTGLDEGVSHSVTFLTILVVFILFTCAAHRNICNFIKLTIFVPYLGCVFATSKCYVFTVGTGLDVKVSSLFQLCKIHKRKCIKL